LRKEPLHSIGGNMQEYSNYRKDYCGTNI
jgi:hypothetical protein